MNIHYRKEDCLQEPVQNSTILAVTMAKMR